MNNRFNTSSGWGIEISPAGLGTAISATARLHSTDQMFATLAGTGDELRIQLAEQGVTATPDEWQQFITWVDSSF